MARGDSVATEDGRLACWLAESLAPELQGALDHPVRRDLLRTLNRGDRAQSIIELSTELRPFRMSQLSYHLQVLRRLGTIVSEPADWSPGRGRPRYGSEVSEDGQVRAVLRATERWDRERREAVAAASASPLLTMFRVPRPVRTIRLRSRRQVESERDQ
jgi:hypothetical protein